MSMTGTEMSARQAAEELVSIALVQPILKELRDTNRAAGAFAPGTGEKTFGPVLDAAMAKQIVQGGRFNVVDAVERAMSNRGGDAVAWSAVRQAKGGAL